MPATFTCPHCGASYPVKPVLVGKPVRCTSCRQAFILGADGIALPVPPPAGAGAGASSPPPPRSAPPPAPAADRPAAAAPVETARAPAAVATAPAPAAPPSASDRLAARGRLTQQQQEARRQMADTLASAANKALREVPSTGATRPAPAAAARVATGRTVAKGESATIGPVLVVGAGERAARERRLVWLSCGAFVVLVVLLVAVAMHRSPTRRALDAFTADPDSRHVHYPLRLAAMQQRAWWTECRVLLDLGSVHLGGVQHLDTHAARPVFAALHGLSLDSTTGLYLAPEAVATAHHTWSPRRARADNLEQIAAHHIHFLDPADIPGQLTAAGVAPEVADLLLELLHRMHGSPQGDAARLIQGEIPDALELVPFSGRGGTELRDTGRSYAFPIIDYRGRLLRFLGQGWSGEWRVLEITSDAP